VTALNKDASALGVKRPSHVEGNNA